MISKLIILTTTLIYFASMFAYPLFHYDFSLNDLMQVWFDWQTLNASIIAIIASYLLFRSTQLSLENQQKVNNKASRVLLNDTLSEICDYLSKIVRIYLDIYSNMNTPNSPLKITIPDRPNNYKDSFDRCIKNSPDITSRSMIDIVINLQVIHSRAKDITDSILYKKNEIITIEYLLANINLAATTQALINRTFKYTRFKSELIDNSELKLQEINNALIGLDINQKLWPELSKARKI